MLEAEIESVVVEHGADLLQPGTDVENIHLVVRGAVVDEIHLHLGNAQVPALVDGAVRGKDALSVGAQNIEIVMAEEIGVRPFSAGEVVDAFPAIQNVVARAAQDGVVSGIAPDLVVLGIAREDIVPVLAHQGFQLGIGGSVKVGAVRSIVSVGHVKCHHFGVLDPVAVGVRGAAVGDVAGDASIVEIRLFSPGAVRGNFNHKAVGGAQLDVAVGLVFKIILEDHVVLGIGVVEVGDLP